MYKAENTLPLSLQKRSHYYRKSRYHYKHRMPGAAVVVLVHAASATFPELFQLLTAERFRQTNASSYLPHGDAERAINLGSLNRLHETVTRV